jgi:hypothetical protein
MGRDVTARRILHLLVLAGLVLAPFGRIGLAQAHALAMPHAAPATMPSHCSGEPAPSPDQDKSDRIDCMTACAAIAAPVGPVFAPPPACGMARVALAAFALAGIRPEAEPPPPRIS